MTELPEGVRRWRAVVDLDLGPAKHEEDVVHIYDDDGPFIRYADLPAILAEERERLAVHCDEMAAKNKVVWRLDADLSEYERTYAKAATLEYEAMARSLRDEDMLGQLLRLAALVSTKGTDYTEEGGS